MDRLEDSIDRIAAETGFSGVVRVDHGDGLQLAKAYGLAHRGCQLRTRSTRSSPSPAAARG